MKVLLNQFFEKVRNGEVEVYNEFSLQHELGIFLRENLSQHKVQFERNSTYFGSKTSTKHEIDISIFNENEKFCAIELKFPRKGQHPEQMFSFIKDIVFLEELKKKIGFKKTYAITLVDDHNFYEGAVPSGSIYTFFRAGTPINGTVRKPTGAKNESYTVEGSYKVKWQNLGNWKFYIVEC